MDLQIWFVYDCLINRRTGGHSMTHRSANIQRHRARRPGREERKRDMEDCRRQINAMLDTIADAKLMKMICEVIKAILFNR